MALRRQCKERQRHKQDLLQEYFQKLCASDLRWEDSVTYGLFRPQRVCVTCLISCPGISCLWTMTDIIHKHHASQSLISGFQPYKIIQRKDAIPLNYWMLFWIVNSEHHSAVAFICRLHCGDELLLSHNEHDMWHDFLFSWPHTI